LYFFPFHQANYYSLANNKRLVLGTAFASILFAFVLSLTGLEKHALTVLIGLPLYLVFLFNTDIIIIASIILLFLHVNTFGYEIVVLSSVPIAISYFIMFKADNSKKAASPLTVPLLIYLASMLPSFWNIHSLFGSLLRVLNLASMILMFTILGNHIKSHRQIKSFAIAFMVFSLINGFDVIKEGLLTKQRVFGFAGIVYVDYVCIAILIAAVAFFYFRNSKSIFFIAAGLILFAALLFTQTRSTMISLLFASLLLLLFLFIYHTTLSIDRKKLFLQLLLFLIVAIFIFSILSSIVPEIFSRINDVVSNKPSTTKNEDMGLVSNSIISRLLIWYTALNAFFRHPIIGIGAYSFCLDSQFYRTIPMVLYKIWVKDLSPHITYLAALTETGIVGLIGFLIFLLSSLRMGFKSITHSKTYVQKYFSLGIFIVQIYICVSMGASDAWLWGQCGMLWSIVLGISVANYKIIMRSSILLGKE
jgi:O-antigen ligase